MLVEKKKGEAIFNYESQTETRIINLARKSNRDSLLLKAKLIPLIMNYLLMGTYSDRLTAVLHRTSETHAEGRQYHQDLHYCFT